jgi:flagellar basal-body rod protein FlgB
MGNTLFTDNSLKAATMALDGLSLRQQVIGRNLANIDTPGYKAQGVNFESTLQRVFSRKEGISLATTQAGHISAATSSVGFQVSQRPGGGMRADQNNVDIDAELTDMSEAGIQYQAMTEAVARKFSLMKYIAK